MIHSAYTIIDYNDFEEPMQYNVKFPFLDQLSINSGAIISQNFNLDQNEFSSKDTWYNFFETEAVTEFLTYDSAIGAVNPAFTQFEQPD